VNIDHKMKGIKSITNIPKRAFARKGRTLSSLNTAEEGHEKDYLRINC